MCGAIQCGAAEYIENEYFFMDIHYTIYQHHHILHFMQYTRKKGRKKRDWNYDDAPA